MQAYTEVQQDKLKDAIKHLQDSLAIAKQQKEENIRLEVAIAKRLGDLLLRADQEQKAISTYKQGLSWGSKLPPNDTLLVGLLEPLVGILLEDQQFEAARPYAEQLVAVCEARSSSGDMLNIASLFWSYIQLLQVYKHIDIRLQEPILAKVLPLTNMLLNLRSQLEGNTIAEQRALFEKLQSSMLRSYITENKPTALSDYLWLTDQFRIRTLPLIRWQPSDGKANAVILCVHGLGLENRAFSSFGRKMAERHFAVYALDVRGFGAWQSEYGSKTVDFDRALNDIGSVARFIKKLNPGLPVYLLGESMGGAIALRAASEFGDEFTGVISSVPSAERFGGTKMAAKVALHLLRDPNKPFDIGTQVTKQATKKTELQQLWKNDPKAKIELTPIELIKFDRFMKTTKQQCSEIRSTPVMIVQGMADKLVKPQGTYEMYDRINSPDKTMIIIGSAEHLIFETLNQSSVLLDGLTAWITNHNTPVQTKAQSQ